MGQQWPKSAEELKAAGYVFDNLGLCKAAICQARLWWFRTPKGKAMPLVKNEVGLFSPHFADCPARESFKKQKGMA